MTMSLNTMVFIVLLCDFTLAARYFGFELKGKDTAISGHQPFQQEHVHHPQECLRRCIRQISQCALAQHELLPGGSGCLCKLFRFISDLPSYLVTKADTELYSLAVQEDCLSWKDEGYQQNGVYRLTNGKAVFCDMNANGGGWTVIQRRIDGSVDFFRRWDDYKNGFGDSNGEYWIGNDVIHNMTKTENIMLKVEATNFDGLTNYIVGDGFWIEDESNGYRLHVGQLLEGNPEHFASLLYTSGERFSTYDRDNDANSEFHCALGSKSGYWHKSCRHLSVNGVYHLPSGCEFNKGIHWKGWLDQGVCLKKISMSIKRKE